MIIRLGTALLLVLATIKVVADVAGWQKLSAVSAVTNAAPAMKVFTAHNGYETFSSTYTLTVFWIDGHQQTVTLNPANYRGLQGPYNRRNVYGAAIAYGPILATSEHAQSMWQSVAQEGFCTPDGVIRELGFNHETAVDRLVVDYSGWQKNESVTTDHNYPNRLEVSCDKV